MSETLSLLFAGFVGILLGLFFFGGLWWTVRQGLGSKYAALWFMGSMLLRTSVVVLGFYVVLGDDWRRLLAGLLGFVIARLCVTWLTRGVEPSASLPHQARHAP